MVSLFQRFCLWLVWDSPIKTGRLAPYIFGLGIGRMPHRVNTVRTDATDADGGGSG